MNTHLLYIKIRSSYPNIRWLRRELARIRIRKMKSRLLPEDVVLKCENDPEEKQRVVKAYSQKFAQYLKPDLKKAKKIFTGPDGVTDEEKVTDAIFCRLAYGFAAAEYLPFQLEKKNHEQRLEYISDIDRFCYVYQMNDISDVQVFNDKVRTYELFHEFYKRSCVKVQTQSDLSAFLSFVREHPVFVKKSAVESLGRSVELVDLQKQGRTAEEYFRSLLKEGGKYIIEEKVEMGAELADISTSVNTVRCIALKTRHGVVIPYCFMRFGRNGSIVDNAGAGGIFAGIDTKTGVINTDGYDRLYDVYKTHPDSGTAFRGLQLPEWESMLSIVKEASSRLPNIHYVGWDMAYSKNGWLIIEGNGMSQIIAPQFIYQKGIKKEILGYMSDMDLITEAP